MNEPHMATWWFPANDHPRDKASFDIRITVPRGKDVVANGVLVSKRKRPGRTTVHWRAVEPMASYLAFFAAGDFETRSGSCNGITNYVAVSKQRPDVACRGEAAKALADADLHDDHGARERAGALPLHRHGRRRDQPPGGVRTGEPDPADVPRCSRGRARAWSRTSSRTSGSATRSPSAAGATSGSTRGSPSTCRPTTPPRWSAATRCRTGSLSTYDTFAPETGFWKLSIDDPGPERLFDGAVYARGSMAVQALRHRIGDAAFWTLLRTWVSQRALRQRLGRRLRGAGRPRSAARTSTAFFDAWLQRTSRRPAKTAANGLV